MKNQPYNHLFESGSEDKIIESTFIRLTLAHGAVILAHQGRGRSEARAHDHLSHTNVIQHTFKFETIFKIESAGKLLDKCWTANLTREPTRMHMFLRDQP